MNLPEEAQQIADQQGWDSARIVSELLKLLDEHLYPEAIVIRFKRVADAENRTLEQAQDAFRNNPMRSTAADYLRVANQYFSDLRVAADTYRNIVKEVEKWLLT